RTWIQGSGRIGPLWCSEPEAFLGRNPTVVDSPETKLLKLLIAHATDLTKFEVTLLSDYVNASTRLEGSCSVSQWVVLTRIDRHHLVKAPRAERKPLGIANDVYARKSPCIQIHGPWHRIVA